MADATRSIFNKTATEKLRSPDDLDKYIRVANPSVWVALAACLALLAGLAVWGVFGAVTTSVSTMGACIDGKVMCFLSAEDVAEVHVGDIANVGGTQMKVEDVAVAPISRDEAKMHLATDFLVSQLVKGDWGYKVTFAGDASELTENVPLAVNITVERIAPINLILGGNSR